MWVTPIAKGQGVDDLQRESTDVRKDEGDGSDLAFATKSPDEPLGGRALRQTARKQSYNNVLRFVLSC